VRNHPDIKGWNYINLDWTRYPTYETWGDARLQINTEIRTRWVDTLTQSRFLNAGYDLTLAAEEGQEPQRAGYVRPSASIVRGMLELAVDRRQNTAYRAALLDIAGRKVLDLHPGPNSVSRLAPGVYFVRHASCVKREASSVTKFIITR
jgi:hypothetical protein